MEAVVRKAQQSDLDGIEEILQGATRYLLQQGLPQWQNGTGPSRLDAQRDIERGEGYVLEARGKLLGYSALEGEPSGSYAAIRDGGWRGDGQPYLSIHRVAISAAERGKGYAVSFLLQLVAVAKDLGCCDIRIDTHPENSLMEKAILRAGFCYCGRIDLPIPEGERKAFQQLLS